eukprot:7899021-Alexandrium_andersonii.AAC.1
MLVWAAIAVEAVVAQRRECVASAALVFGEGHAAIASRGHRKGGYVLASLRLRRGSPKRGLSKH